MKLIVHKLVQGTEAWHQFRAEHDGASEAAAMLGLSKYVSRSELLRQKATGIAQEVDENKQRLFDAGHATEAAARPIAEGILGDSLYPATYSLGRLSASVDGITMDECTAFEHKLHRSDLAEAVGRGELPDEYQPQCQQVMMVTGAEKVLFMVSDGTLTNCAHVLVYPDPSWQKRITAGWAQFHADLANYQHVEVLPAAVAAPTMQLPALSIQVTGSIALVDNLKVFGERLESFIQGIDKAPQDDQGFADAEAAIKTLGTAETALEAAKASALAQTASIDDMVRTVKLYADQARATRLMLEKMVKARKESIRVEIVQGGKDALASHIAGLNKRLGKPYMPAIHADFAGAAKGKRTIASLRDAVDTELARAKIEGNEIADRMQVNLKSLDNLAAGYDFLFRDLGALLHMDAEAFDAIVISRVNANKQAEEDRIEAERAKIRAEEQAKLQREQEAKERAQADKARLEAARIQQEGIERAAKEAEARRAEMPQAGPLTRPEIATGGQLEAVTTPAAHAAITETQGDVAVSRGAGIVGYSPAYGATCGASSTGSSKPSAAAITHAVAESFGVSPVIAHGWLVDYFSNQQQRAA